MGMFNTTPTSGRTQYGKLIWVIGHTGMERNESTDQIAEAGSQVTCWPRTSLRLSKECNKASV